MNSDDVPLIPREIFFDNPERAAATISPDSSQLMWLAPLNGVLNIWVAARDDLASARPLTRDNGIPVIYAFYPDEGHGFARSQNRRSFFAMVEAFLAKYIGGRHEPHGEDFDGSSAQIVAGIEQIPGLEEMLAARATEKE